MVSLVTFLPGSKVTRLTGSKLNCPSIGINVGVVVVVVFVAGGGVDSSFSVALSFKLLGPKIRRSYYDEHSYVILDELLLPILNLLQLPFNTYYKVLTRYYSP